MKSTAVLLVLILLGSGCLTHAKRDEGDAPRDTGDHVVYDQSPVFPLYIPSEGTLEVVMPTAIEEYDTDCYDNELMRDAGDKPQYFSYSVLDRYGKVEAKTIYYPPPAPGEPDPYTAVIHLEGTPPFVVGGELPFCVFHMEVEVTGPAGMMGVVDNASFAHHNLDLPVATGERVAKISWEPSPYIHRLLIPMVVDSSRNGTPYGTATLWTPDGDVMKQDIFQPWGRTHRVPQPVAWIAGVWTVEVELMYAAIPETEWRYNLYVREYDSSICALGFEWDDLCT